MQNPNIPVTVKAETVTAEMAAKPGWKFVQALLTVFLPKSSETQTKVASRYVFVLDHSGSTGDPIGEKKIYKVMAEGCIGVVNLMSEQDEVCVIQFDDQCDQQDVLCEPVSCDVDGKAEARMAFNSISPNGTTNFSVGLNRATQYLRSTPKGKNPVLIFVSDGQTGHADSENAITACQEFEKQGVMVYTCCINNGAVGNAGEKILSDMTGGKRFQPAKTDKEVVDYFKTVLKSAQSAAITQAVVEFRPTKFVRDHMGADENNQPKMIPGIAQIDMIRKNGTPVCVSGSVITRNDRLIGEVKIDQVGPGDTLEIQLGFNTEVKDFGEGFISGDRSFGRVYLVGSCTGENIANQELASCDMAVSFSSNPARVQNKRVLNAIGVAAGMRAQKAVEQTTDVKQQREILFNAKKVVQGTMALGADDATLQAVLAGLRETETESLKGGDAAARKAREGTQVLKADDASAALAGLE